MRSTTKRRGADLWDAMPQFAVAAIELATGVIFKRTLAPPVGLYSVAHDLKAQADKKWTGDYTVGAMARLYLDVRCRYLQDLRERPGRGIVEERADGSSAE